VPPAPLPPDPACDIVSFDDEQPADEAASEASRVIDEAQRIF
jgi:hypothetical protein